MCIVLQYTNCVYLPAEAACGDLAEFRRPLSRLAGGGHRHWDDCALGCDGRWEWWENHRKSRRKMLVFHGI